MTKKIIAGFAACCFCTCILSSPARAAELLTTALQSVGTPPGQAQAGVLLSKYGPAIQHLTALEHSRVVDTDTADKARSMLRMVLDALQSEPGRLECGFIIGLSVAFIIGPLLYGAVNGINSPLEFYYTASLIAFGLTLLLYYATNCPPAEE